MVEDALPDTRRKSLRAGWSGPSIAVTGDREVAVVAGANMERLGAERVSLLGWTRWMLVEAAVTWPALALPWEYASCPSTCAGEGLVGFCRAVPSYSAKPRWMSGDATAHEAEDLAA